MREVQRRTGQLEKGAAGFQGRLRKFSMTTLKRGLCLFPSGAEKILAAREGVRLVLWHTGLGSGARLVGLYVWELGREGGRLTLGPEE